MDPNKIINDAGNLTIRQNVAIRACRFSNTIYSALSRIAVTCCFKSKTEMAKELPPKLAPLLH